MGRITKMHVIVPIVAMVAANVADNTPLMILVHGCKKVKLI